MIAREAREVLQGLRSGLTIDLARVIHKLVSAEAWELLVQLTWMGLQMFPKDPILLRAGRDAWWRKGDTKQAWRLAKKLNKHGLENRDDIAKNNELLLLLGRVGKARRELRMHLATDPRNKDYLSLASDICRIRGVPRESLFYAYRLIKTHPQSWRGYQRAAEDLIALEECSRATAVLEEGVSKLSDQNLAKGLAARLRVDTCEALLNHTNTKTFMGCWQSIQVWSDPIRACSPLPHNHKCLPQSQQIQKDINCNSSQDIDVIQYWSQGEPPEEITSISRRWNQLLSKLGFKPIHLYSREAAKRWIDAYAPEFITPFNTAFHYAVESDVFRIAYASRRSCLYIDCDQWPFAWTGNAIGLAAASGASTLCMSSTRPSILNGIFIAQAGCAYFKKVASSCANLDFSQRTINAQTILNTFGPGKYLQVMRYLLKGEKKKVGFRPLGTGLAELHIGELRLIVANEQVIGADKPPKALAYKQTEQQWQIFVAQQVNS